MKLDSDLVQQLQNAFNLDAAIELLRRAVQTPSITGNEASFADLLHAELLQTGVDEIVKRDFLPGRPNVWGWRKSAAQGPRILLIGHTDTVHVRGWTERWKGTERENPFGGAAVDGELWGRGAADLKAGLCTTIMALRVLDRAKLPLSGDVVFAFVGDEESGEPDSGVSAGMKAFASAIEAGEVPRPDLAIYVEPTEIQIYTAQIGFFIAEVTLTGRSAYFGTPELGVDALRAAHLVLQGLWDHSRAIETSGEHPLLHRSFLLVTEIKAGGYIAVPGDCRIMLIRTLRPGENLDEARLAMEAVIENTLKETGVSYKIRYPAGRDHPVGGTPYETNPNNPEIQRLSACLKTFAPDRGSIAGAPYWSEAPFLGTRLGIPTVYCAPGDIRICHTLEERVPIEEYRLAILAFAAFLAGAGR
jgi:acetylornithine deacetylase/succinyl-diaminopimelate desuccinylase-like protein